MNFLLPQGRCVSSLPNSQPDEYRWHYTYDDLSRVSAACAQWNATTSACEGDAWTYTYDGAGNLLRFDKWSEGTITPTRFVYNGANQSQCIDADASGVCDGTEFVYQYDAYGNLLNDGSSTYIYDAALRLSSVTTGEGTTTYQYNGDGDRVAQTVNGVQTAYVIDTATPLTMVLAETTGTSTIRYLHGLDLVAQSDGVSIEYFAYDGLGSVRQVLDAAGLPLLTQTFDPYGNPYSYAGPSESATSYGFTGEQTDSNGLVFLRARYYDPKQGRFFQRDSWRGEPDHPLTLNPYMYGLGNPVLLTDPSGQFPVLFAAAVVVGSIVIAGVTTAAWAFNEHGGWNNLECMDWSAVGAAGFAGATGAASAWMSPLLLAGYIGTYLIGGMTPSETNAALLSYLGIAPDNPYFIAGQGGGTLASLALGFAMLWFGGPTMAALPSQLVQQGNVLAVVGGAVIALPNVGGLVAVGVGAVGGANVIASIHNSSDGENSEPWTLDKEGSDRIAVHKKNGRTYWRREGSSEWWSQDDAGHGGSAFKVYQETRRGLEWVADADEYGQFIVGKHKSDAGTFIPWKDLRITWRKPGT